MTATITLHDAIEEDEFALRDMLDDPALPGHAICRLPWGPDGESLTVVCEENDAALSVAAVRLELEERSEEREPITEADQWASA